MNTIAYKIGNKLYLNLTNKCSNNCTFCVRNHFGEGYEGYYLWLDKEPTVPEVIDAMGDISGYDEIVFCGFGEPLYRLDDIITLCDYIHSKNKKTRMNTNGQADLIVGEGVAEKLAGKLDSINISLNETDKESYQKICKCVFGEKGFDSLLKFAKECSKTIPNVYLSVVDVIGDEEIKKAQAIADKIGVKLRVREYQ